VGGNKKKLEDFFSIIFCSPLQDSHSLAMYDSICLIRLPITLEVTNRRIQYEYTNNIRADIFFLLYLLPHHFKLKPLDLLLIVTGTTTNRRKRRIDDVVDIYINNDTAPIQMKRPKRIINHTAKSSF
jgi:2-keto-4-pentenoate hydratase/2-oxohepta-3-ene-1,7-dioic acid hydratase in catechol pathway